MIKRKCTYPCCSEWAVEGHKLCKKHLAESDARREKYLEEKKSKSKPFASAYRYNSKFYNSAKWRALKQKIIKDCGAVCSICGASAEDSGHPLEVHHILPPKGNETIFFCEDNLMVVCHQCHCSLTAREVSESKLLIR